MPQFQRPHVIALASLAFAGVALATLAATDEGSRLVDPNLGDEPTLDAGAGQVREFTVNGRDNTFAPGRLEVNKDDLVKVTFTAADIAHSFTLDSYRISKRAGAGQTVVLEFRADRTGSFEYYCNLTQDDKCRQMKGELVVR